jgi:hypothetical protein
MGAVSIAQASKSKWSGVCRKQKKEPITTNNTRIEAQTIPLWEAEVD